MSLTPRPWCKLLRHRRALPLEAPRARLSSWATDSAATPGLQPAAWGRACRPSEPSPPAILQASSLGVAGATALLAVPAVLWWQARGRADGGAPLPLPPALRAAGASVEPGLRLRRCRERGAGLFVGGAVPAGTTLIRVPAAAVLSGERARGVLGATAEALEPEVALCALLAEARREAEVGKDALGLREYLQALPRTFPSLPLHLVADEAGAEELKGTALLAAAEALRWQSEGERELALACLGEALTAIWSPELWLWAKAVLLTRAGPNVNAAHGALAGTGRCAAIVPLVDFANCAELPTAECQLSSDGDVRLVTLRDLQPGEEVTLSYGTQSQEELLFTFGFSLPGAAVVATSPLPLESAESKLQSALLRVIALDRSDEEGGGISGFPLARITRAAGAGADAAADASELWAAANILEMSDAELKQLAAEVAGTGSLPRALKQRASPPAQRRLRNLLEAWRSELGPPSSRPGKQHFLAAHSYRTQCRQLVDAALQQLCVEEASEVGAGATAAPTSP